MRKGALWSILILKIRDTIKCTFEINGPNYRDAWNCLMKLLSKQTNMVEGHSKGDEEQEVDTGKIIKKIIFYLKVKFT